MRPTLVADGVRDTTGSRPAVRADYVDSGCDGVRGSFRATENSLMHSNLPALGSVNRRWAEQVLELWSGDARR